MKVYFYSCKKNINTYLLINETSKEAILIDPCIIPKYFIEKLENEHLSLKAACITNTNLEEIKRGVKTWQNIYNFSVFEPSNIFDDNINSTKELQLSSLNIEVFYIRTNPNSFCMYKIENTLFTGQSLLTSIFQFSSNKTQIRDKLQTFDKNITVFPLSGPPTTVKNLEQDLTKKQPYIREC
jgi:hypothetical protein